MLRIISINFLYGVLLSKHFSIINQSKHYFDAALLQKINESKADK